MVVVWVSFSSSTSASARCSAVGGSQAVGKESRVPERERPVLVAPSRCGPERVVAFLVLCPWLIDEGLPCVVFFFFF